MNQEIIEKSWSFVNLFKAQVLVVDFFGEIKIFTLDSFKPKSRDFFENEVIGARDITLIVENLQISLGLDVNKSSLEARWNNLPKKDFSFSHDQYVKLKSIKENEY